MQNNLWLVFLILGFLTLLSIVFYYFYYFFLNKKQLLKKINSDLDLIDPNNLKNKFELLINFEENNNKHIYNELIEEIDNLNQDLKNQVSLRLDFLNQNKNKFFLTNEEKNEIKEISKNLHNLKINYLDIQFKINELNYDEEIIYYIINYVKNKFKDAIDIQKNFSEKENKIFSKNKDEEIEIEHILNNFNKINIKENLFEVNNKLINLINKIELFYKKIMFFKNINKIVNNLQEKLNKIVENFERNNKQLSNINLVINKKIFEIESLKKDVINSMGRDFNEKNIEKITKLINLVKNLENEILLEENTFLFLKVNSNSFLTFIKKFEEFKNVIFQNSNIWNKENSEKKIKTINFSLEKIKEDVKAYKKIKSEPFSYDTNKIIFIKIKDILGEYKKIIINLINFSKETLLIINKKDQINKIIANINNKLLKIEYLFYNLHINDQKKYENTINNFKKIENNLIKTNKPSNIDNFSEQALIKINEFNIKINEFNNKMYSLLYVIIYIEKMIVILNKYRISNLEISYLLDEIEKEYKNNNIEKSLELAIKLCKGNKIYE